MKISNFQFPISKEKGFTLIEAVVATAVFAFVIVGILGVYASTLQLDSKTRAQRAVTQNARFIMEFMAKEVRNGQIDYSKTNSTTELSIINQSLDQEHFALTGQDLKLDKNGGTATNLNTPGVKVTNLKFYVNPTANPYTIDPTSRPDEQPRLTITIELTSNFGTRAQDTAKLNLESTFATRVYPSRVVPASTSTGAPSIVIKAYSVVCLTEADLPNWSGSGVPTQPQPSQITSTTASDYVANSGGQCWLDDNWSFQYGYLDGSSLGVDEPEGDLIGPADGTSTQGQCGDCGTNTFTGSNYGDWKNFDTTTTGGGYTPAFLNLLDLQDSPGIWVREILKPGYVPFSSPPGDPYNYVSAEFNCTNDIGFYDNFAALDAPAAGVLDYYCVAFNALDGTIPPPTPPGPAPTPSPAPSPDRTCVPPASSITDGNLDVWTLSSGEALKNGGSVGGYGDKILWYNNTIYVLGGDSNWYQWFGNGWGGIGPSAPASCL